MSSLVQGPGRSDQRQPWRTLSSWCASVVLLLGSVMGAAASHADPIFPPPQGTVARPPAEASYGTLKPIAPVRVRDSRTTIGGLNRALAPGTTTTVKVAGVGGVPATGAVAVVANITVITPAAGGYLTGFPTGTTKPATSNLNFAKGQTVPNLTILKIGTNGNISLFNGSAGNLHYAVDITGYLTSASADLDPDTQSPSVEKPRGSTTLDRFLPPSTTTARALPTALGSNAAHGDMNDLRASTDLGTHLDTAPSQADTGETFAVGAWGYLQTAPDPAVGRLFNLNAAGDTYTGFCSGTIVARNLVLTAAHCVNSPNYGFAPQTFGAASPYGFWRATAYWISPYYGNGSNSGADYAFLLFDNTNSSGQYLGDVTGWFGIASDPPSGLKYSIGYPSEGWFSFNCSSAASCWPVFCSSTLDLASQYSQKANDPSVSYGGWWTQGFGCYMTGGSSGGPVFQQLGGAWYVVGVNSHVDFGPTYTQDCTRPSGVCGWYSRNMWAPYFNQRIIDAWAQLRRP